MALRIVKANDPVVIEHVNLCIYGAPGLGKTSLAFTAEEPILLDFDGGSHRALNRKDTVPIKSWTEVTTITPEDLQPYKTVIVDTAGRGLDFLTGDIIAANPKMGRGGALTLQGYGELKSKFASWLNMLRLFGKDVVLIAHMDEQRSGDDIVERLDVQGGSKGEIYKSVDAMGRIYMQGKNRVLDFSPRENSFGKNPCGLEIIPFQPPSGRPELLKEIIASMKQQMNRLTANQLASQRELEEWAEALKDFETVDDFNRCLDDVKNASRAIKSMFNKKAKDLGLTYNASAGSYEATHATVS